jgi:hypothetical protein
VRAAERNPANVGIGHALRQAISMPGSLRGDSFCAAEDLLGRGERQRSIVTRP